MKYKFYINKRLHDVDPIIANYPLSKYYFNNVYSTPTLSNGFTLGNPLSRYTSPDISQYLNNISYTPGPRNIDFNTRMQMPIGNTGLTGNSAISLASGLLNGVSGFITGGNSTNWGNAAQTLGSIASNIPGIGGAIGLGLQATGIAGNALFGSNINKDFVRATQARANALKNYQSDATTNNSLLQDWNNLGLMSAVRKSDVGTEGVFSDKATNTTRNLNRDIAGANADAIYGFYKAADKVDALNDFRALQGLYASGGRKRRVDFSSYKPVFDRKFTPAYMEQLQDSLISRNYDEPQRLAFMSSVLHESGGNPKAVDATGKFQGIAQWGNDRFPGTWNLGEQIHNLLETSENVKTPNWSDGGPGIPKTMTAKDAYNDFWNATTPYNATLYYNKGYVRPATEKMRINRAKEAENMAKYLKADGGIHIKPSKKGTFTAAATRHGMGVQEFASKVLANKEDYSPAMVKKANFARNAAKWHADGGSIHGIDFDNGLTFINNGGSHETNPHAGVHIGGNDYVEQGEVVAAGRKFDDNVDYVMSARLPITDDLANKYGLKKGQPYSKALRTLSKEFNERPNDPISKNGMKAIVNDFKSEQEKTRYMLGLLEDSIYALGGKKLHASDPVIKPKATWMRKAPIAASFLGLMSNIFDKPDTSAANAMLDYASRIAQPVSMPVATIGDYRKKKFFNEAYPVNLLNQNSNAAARLAANTSGGNRAMGLAAASNLAFNRQLGLADAAIKAFQANRAEDASVSGFNRDTNLANMQAENARNAALASLNSQRQIAGYEMAAQALANRQAIRNAQNQQLSANISQLAQNLHDLGYENLGYNQANSLAREGYSPVYIDENGILRFIAKKCKGGKIRRRF